MWFKKLFRTKRANQQPTPHQTPTTSSAEKNDLCLHRQHEKHSVLQDPLLSENVPYVCKDLVINGKDWVVVENVNDANKNIADESTDSDVVYGPFLPDNPILVDSEESDFEDVEFTLAKVVYGHVCHLQLQEGQNKVTDRAIGDWPTQKYFGLSEREDVIIRFNIVEYRQFGGPRRFVNGIDYPGKKTRKKNPLNFCIPFGVEAKEKYDNILQKIWKMCGCSVENFIEWMKRAIAPPRLQALRGNRRHGGSGNNNGAPGDGVRAYALHLAADKTTTFAQNVENFITCTKDSKETCPHVVMRNMRQFMSGMKNYLVKHGEREFEKEVEKERLKLKANEFLNLDSILEGVLHGAVVTPLRSHLYSLLADKFTKSGDVNQLAVGMRLARSMTPFQLGIKSNVRTPSNAEIVEISQAFVKMQEADSPLQKLEHLLTAISLIYNAMKIGAPSNGALIGADDFLPILVLTLARCSVAGAELEAEVMAGLLPPPILSGEGGYYLTTLFGAVAVLKKISSSEKNNKPFDWKSGSLGSTLDCGSGSSVSCGVARVLVPDELTGALRRVALPWRAGTRARDFCRALAQRARITNPQDYALYALRDGEEIMINEPDSLQDVISDSKYSNCMLAYKRSDAKIAWPKQAFNSYP